MAERLTFEGNFCDIAKCREERWGKHCPNGACSQRKVWERLKAYEDTGAVPAVSVPQWISVKDRMPEDNDRVIAFRPYEAEVSAYRYSVMWGWALKTSVSHRGITHWMPLPEPPKGENDG